METLDFEILMTSAEVAKILAITEKTLANWRYRRVIPYLKIHGIVRYRKKDIDAFIASNLVS